METPCFCCFHMAERENLEGSSYWKLSRHVGTIQNWRAVNVVCTSPSDRDRNLTVPAMASWKGRPQGGVGSGNKQERSPLQKVHFALNWPDMSPQSQCIFKQTGQHMVGQCCHQNSQLTRMHIRATCHSRLAKPEKQKLTCYNTHVLWPYQPLSHHTSNAVDTWSWANSSAVTHKPINSSTTASSTSAFK